MSVITKIRYTENVSIISFEKAQAHIKIIAILFDELAKSKINVDMISQSAPKGDYNTISFTVSDENLTGVLSVIKKLKEKHSSLLPLVSSGNVKISIYGEDMPKHFGVAADVFIRLNEQNIDTLLITTSDVDISIVVTSANADKAVTSLQEAYLK